MQARYNQNKELLAHRSLLERAYHSQGRYTLMYCNLLERARHSPAGQVLAQHRLAERMLAHWSLLELELVQDSQAGPRMENSRDREKESRLVARGTLARLVGMLPRQEAYQRVARHTRAMVAGDRWAEKCSRARVFPDSSARPEPPGSPMYSARLV